jgi:GNAT superfamily N-acetyltransferase
MTTSRPAAPEQTKPQRIRARSLSAADIPQVPALADVLLDCVAGGASVSFMASLTRDEAEAFFANALKAVDRGERIVLAAFGNSTGGPANESAAETADVLTHPESAILEMLDPDALSEPEPETALVGTVQILLATPPNQPHRADIAKLLVRRSARSRGIAALLMQHAEQAALAAGKTLLVLDTVTGDPAERLYLRLGWTEVGVIPNYALYPDGRPCDTTVFYKQLS